MTYESRNNMLLSVPEERRTISAPDLSISWSRVTRKVSDSNADLVVVFHSSTNCVSQNAGRTSSNRNREAATVLSAAPFVLLLPSPSVILNCRRQKAYRMNTTIRDSPETRIGPFKTLEALILPVVVEWLQIVSVYVACWATQIM
jgi:hypothetical protein